MSTTTKQYQMLQKYAANSYMLLHPETDADIVKLAVEGITATNVQDAIAELNENIIAITGGGVVTGVKGDAETTYRLGQVNITKANIGLGNVDNTSDANKPVSTATQTELNKKANTDDLGALATKDSLTNADIGLGNVTNDAQVKRSEMGVANGVATLDTTGKVLAAQLPSYVDDVLSYANKAGFPASGETGKIYVAEDTNKTYRWSGTAYVEISESLALGETASTAYAGDKGKKNAEDIAALQTSVNDLSDGLSDYVTLDSNQDISGAKTFTKRIYFSNREAVGSVGAIGLDSSGNVSIVTDTFSQTIQKKAGTIALTADVDTVKTIAETANTKATNANTSINNIYNGNTPVGVAAKLFTKRDISLMGDATGSAKFDGSANAEIDVTLANSGVLEGTYSAITVDAKGRATAGAQVIEIGATGATEPSASLALGGLFFKEI